MDTTTAVNEIIEADYLRLSNKFIKRIQTGDIEDYDYLWATGWNEIFRNLWEDYSDLN